MLQGIKVIELCTYIAGPGAACILSDWGADVVKIERPGGDAMRFAFADVGGIEVNPMFEMDNRGKRSAIIDITQEEGVRVLKSLIAKADVFITNTRANSLKKRGLDEAALRKLNPRLIYALITGYGTQGDDSHKAAFDVTAFWGRAGVARMFTPKDADLFMVRTGVGDHITSLAAASAILGALYEREKTGNGKFVQASLLAAGVYTIGSDLSIQLRFGKMASHRSRKKTLSPLANLYRSADGHWLVLNPRIQAADWPALAAALGREDLIEDPRFKDGPARRSNGEALVEELDRIFSGFTLEDIAARLDTRDLAWSPVQDARQVANDPQVRAAGALVEVEDGEGKTFLSPAAPVTFPGTAARTLPPTPQAGQHTGDVLRQAGVSQNEIQRLVAAGVLS